MVLNIKKGRLNGSEKVLPFPMSRDCTSCLRMRIELNPFEVHVKGNSPLKGRVFENASILSDLFGDTQGWGQQVCLH